MYFVAALSIRIFFFLVSVLEEYILLTCTFNRQTGQDSIDELRDKDFRRDLEERERKAVKERSRERGSRSNAESKRSRLEQAPSNLDADDPVDDDEDEVDSDER